MAIVIVITLLFSCKTDKKQTLDNSETTPTETPYEATLKNPYQVFRGMTVESRFLAPEGYTRVPVAENSFSEYLRQLPLKTPGALVHYYDGRTKPNEDIYEAVVDLPIGSKDLHQCADAIMRLRAEHLWFQERYEDIHFNFTNGHKVEYKEWMKGRRMIVEGNKTSWNQGSTASNSFQDLWSYLELIFTYAGTLSLSNELKKVVPEELSIGDIFIEGGTPGHGVIVVDVAQHMETEEKIFLVAQSFMPAQELQILTNRSGKLGPWYQLKPEKKLRLPEWEFDNSDLMRFPD